VKVAGVCFPVTVRYKPLQRENSRYTEGLTESSVNIDQCIQVRKLLEARCFCKGLCVNPQCGGVERYCRIFKM
jgi:hypothetical protein